MSYSLLWRKDLADCCGAQCSRTSPGLVPAAMSTVTRDSGTGVRRLPYHFNLPAPSCMAGPNTTYVSLPIPPSRALPHHHPLSMLTKGTIVVITSFTRLGLLIILTNIMVWIWSYWVIQTLQTPDPSEATGQHIPLQPIPMETPII